MTRQIPNRIVSPFCIGVSQKKYTKKPNPSGNSAPQKAAMSQRMSTRRLKGPSQIGQCTIPKIGLSPSRGCRQCSQVPSNSRFMLLRFNNSCRYWLGRPGRRRVLRHIKDDPAEGPVAYPGDGGVTLGPTKKNRTTTRIENRRNHQSGLSGLRSCTFVPAMRSPKRLSHFEDRIT